MREEQAKTKQCCGPEGCGYFNDEPWPARWCVGSGCMAWRPTPETERFECVKANAADHGTTYAQEGWTLESNPNGPHWTRWVTIPAGGFCGLAGKEF